MTMKVSDGKTCIDCKDYDRISDSCQNEESGHYMHVIKPKHPACGKLNV